MKHYHFVSTIEVDAENENEALDKLEIELRQGTVTYLLDETMCPDCKGVTLHNEGCPQIDAFREMCSE